MATADLTAQRLRTLLNYDPETGVFTWIAKSAPRANTLVGSVAGTVIDGGYIRVTVDRRFYRAHRLAWLYMTGEWPLADIDHINGQPSDNRWANLRDVPRSVNLQNRRVAMGHNTTSGILGVSKKRDKWRARIKFDGRDHVSTHDSIEDAQAAYLASKRAHHSGNTL